MNELFNSFFQVLRIPLSFMPAGVHMYFNFVIGVFSLFLAGRLLRWLWDILPFA